jgi:hypothetical protein
MMVLYVSQVVQVMADNGLALPISEFNAKKFSFVKDLNITSIASTAHISCEHDRPIKWKNIRPIKWKNIRMHILMCHCVIVSY